MAGSACGWVQAISPSFAVPLESLAVSMRRRNALPWLAIFLLAAQRCLTVAAADFEHEPVLPTAELAQSGLLSGPGYAVEAQTPIVGFMARFTLDTDHGTVVADSVEMLGIRVAEMAAIDVLDEIGRSEAFGMAVRESLTEATETVGRIVTQPVSTIAGLPEGVARYFRDQAVKWGGRLRRHGDRIADKARNDGDPYDMIGPMNAGRDAQPEREQRPWYGSVAREATRQVKDYVGHSGAKRMLARELGIDPYTATTNRALNERLNALAWSASVGAFGVDKALGYLPRGGRETLSQSSRLNDVVWELEPEDLRARNRAILEKWCGDDFQIRRFVRHRAFLVSVQTKLVDALDALRPFSGCEDLLDLALAADHEVEARFLANALTMAHDFIGEPAREAVLEAVAAGITLRLDDGRRVLPLPVDHLSWTKLAAEFFDRPELAEGERIVLVSGSVSDRALRELTSLGWEIVVRAPYGSAPPYAARCCW